MTLHPFFLALLLFAPQESSPVAGFSSYIDHQRYDFSISPSALSDSPSWSDTEAFPPLSPRTDRLGRQMGIPRRDGGAAPEAGRGHPWQHENHSADGWQDRVAIRDTLALRRSLGPS